MYTSKIMIPLN